MGTAKPELTVRELIIKLLSVDQDAVVGFSFRGSSPIPINTVDVYSEDDSQVVLSEE